MSVSELIRRTDILAAGFGTLVLAGALALGRFDLAIAGLVFVVPLILSPLLARWIQRDERADGSAISPLLFDLAFVASFLGALWAYFAIGRGVIFYSVTALTAGVLAAEAVSARPRSLVVVTKTILAHAMIILTINLAHPYYFGATDVFVHEELIRAVAVSGHVDPNIFGEYYAFHPGHALMGATVALLTGLSPRVALFAWAAASSTLVIVGIYAFTTTLTRSKTNGLVAAVLAAVGINLVFNGAYAVPRTEIAYIFPVLLLTLLLPRSVRSAGLVVLMSLLIVYFHSVGAAQIVVLLSFIWIVSLGMRKLGWIDRAVFPGNYLMFIIVTIGTYWTLLTVTPLRYSLRVYSTFLLETTTQTTIDAIDPVVKGVEFAIENLNYSLAFIFLLATILYLVPRPTTNRPKSATLLLWCGVVPLLGYVPWVDSIGFLKALEPWRWRLYVEILAIPAIAFGVVLLAQRTTRPSLVAFVTVVVLAFVSIAGPLNAPDAPAIGAGTLPLRNYLLASEVACADLTGKTFQRDALPDAPVDIVFSDFTMWKYLSSRAILSGITRIDSSTNEITLPRNSRIVLERTEAIETGGVELNVGQSGIYSVQRYVDPDLASLATLNNEWSRVISTGSCALYVTR